MLPSEFALSVVGQRAETKIARCLVIYWMMEAGALPATKNTLANRFGVSRHTIDRDLAAVQAARQIAEELIDGQSLQ